MYDHLPTQDENWTQNLRDYGEYRKEMWNDKHEPCGVWEWFYDAEKRTRSLQRWISKTRGLGNLVRNWRTCVW